MILLEICGNCNDIKESHAMDAPVGKQECLEEGCDCKDYEEEVQ